MTTEEWKLEKDLCRCCHSEGLFKNLAEPCTNLDRDEIYTDMLRDCMDVNLAPVPGLLCAVTYTICDACIIRLRDAFTFKHQVLECEKRFIELYNKDAITVVQSSESLEVKVEPDSYTNDLKDEFSEDDGIDDEDFAINYDEDSDIPESPKKRPKKDKTKSKKTKKTVRKPGKSDSQETSADAVKKRERTGAPPFRLREEDYTRVGTDYQCSRCDKRYDKFFSLRYHIKTKHYKIPKYTCPYCGKHFMTPAPLTVHKLEEHNVDDRYNCNACKGTFNTKVQLRKHINIFHMLGERFKCDFCDYESFSFEGMYKHKFKHKTVKDYHCKFCRKSFLRKTTLDLHERIHTGDRRKVCKVCGQAFVQKASLNYHMTKYHPEVNF